MKSNLINNMDLKTLTSHINILRIIAQATVELVLARYAQLYGGICENVEISLSAKSKLDQTIEIELGSNGCQPTGVRSEEHTSELQSLMRISYAVFCLKKKIKITIQPLNKKTHT